MPGKNTIDDNWQGKVNKKVWIKVRKGKLVVQWKSTSINNYIPVTVDMQKNDSMQSKEDLKENDDDSDLNFKENDIEEGEIDVLCSNHDVSMSLDDGDPNINHVDETSNQFLPDHATIKTDPEFTSP